MCDRQSHAYKPTSSLTATGLKVGTNGCITLSLGREYHVSSASEKAVKLDCKRLEQQIHHTPYIKGLP